MLATICKERPVDFDPLPLATAFGLLIALIGMWRSEHALNRSKDNELHLLRQNLRLKAEAALSEWYKLARENDGLMHSLALNIHLTPEQRLNMSDFLQGWKEHLSLCIADSSAFAKDAHANCGSYSYKECRERVDEVEVSLEVIKRNQGESQRRYNQLMETAATHNGTGAV
jgi:hypothetical protein